MSRPLRRGAERRHLSRGRLVLREDRSRRERNHGAPRAAGRGRDPADHARSSRSGEASSAHQLARQTDLMAVEEKWKANQEKVAFTKQFPGLTLDWKLCEGKTVQAVIPMTGKQGAAVVVFADGSYTVVPPLMPEPWELGQALVDARAHLEPTHTDAYIEYDRLVKKDRDALK